MILSPRRMQCVCAVFRLVNLPIGSGFVESAIRHVINLRQEYSGNVKLLKSCFFSGIFLCGALGQYAGQLSQVDTLY